MRKMLHYTSSVIPIGYLFIEKNIVLMILGGILLIMLVVEYVKYKSNFVYDMYLKIFKHMLREHEYDKTHFRITGASWVIFAALLCILIFPKFLAVMGLLMLAFADSSAAIIGRIFGKKQYAPNRSYVGTITFFVVGTVIILFTPKYFYTAKEYIILFIAVIVTTAVDVFTLPIDDNFTIPVVCCTVLYLLYLLLYPGMVF